MKSDVKITRSKRPTHVHEVQRRAWKTHRRWRFVILFILGIGVMIGVYWVIVGSDLMRFENMEIRGANHLSQEDVRLFLEHRIPARNTPKSLLGYSHFWVWPSEWENGDLKELPHLKKVDFDADYKERKLLVSVTERNFVGVWCNDIEGGTDCVWFDEEGIAFEPSLKPDGYLVFHVDDQASTSRKLGEKVIGDDFFENLMILEEVLRSIGASYRLYELNADRSEVSVQLRNGPLLRFSLEFPSHYITDILTALRRREIFSQLSYIDFRIQNKVFYK